MNGKTETILFPPSDSIHKEPIFYITCKHIHLWYLLVYIIIFGRGRTCPTIQLCSLHCLRGCETYFKAFLQCNHPPSNYLHSLNMNGTRGGRNDEVRFWIAEADFLDYHECCILWHRCSPHSGKTGYNICWISCTSKFHWHKTYSRYAVVTPM